MGKMKDIYTFLQEIGINIDQHRIPVDFAFKLSKETDIENMTTQQKTQKEEAIAQAFKDMSELAEVLQDDNKALEAWKKGFVAADFLKPEYKGLPIAWVWNLLDVDNKSIYTRSMPHY